MAKRPTYADLKDRVAELEQENQALNEKLDSIMDIASDDVPERQGVQEDRQGQPCDEMGV